MILAVASGKGGTGKTTVSAAIALASDEQVMLLDCDVEEPNARIFMGIDLPLKTDVSIMVPSIDGTRCTGCGACAAFCRYHALAVVNKKPLVFPDMCHSCGGCTRICPTGAISEKPVVIGITEAGNKENRSMVQGLLTIGHAMSPPLIRAVKKSIPSEGQIIIDCPPGTSCPMITAVRGADFIILVTEPTPFGLHDLSLAVQTVRKLNIPFGVIINRADSGNSGVLEYCAKENIRVLLSIPESRLFAQAYSNGNISFESIPGIEAAMKKLPHTIKDILSGRVS